MRIEINDGLPSVKCALRDLPGGTVLWSGDGGLTFTGLVRSPSRISVLGTEVRTDFMVVAVDREIHDLSWLDEEDSIVTIVLELERARLIASSEIPAGVAGAFAQTLKVMSGMRATSIRSWLIGHLAETRHLAGMRPGREYRWTEDGGWELIPVRAPLPPVAPGDEDLSDIPL